MGVIKKIFLTCAISKQSPVSRFSRLTLKRSEPLKHYDLDLLFFTENPDFGKFYIIYGAVRQWRFVRHEVTRGNPDGALSKAKRIFFSSLSLEREGREKSVHFTVNQLFENIDMRSDLNQSKYSSTTSVFAKTMILQINLISTVFNTLIKFYCTHTFEYLFFINF